MPTNFDPTSYLKNVPTDDNTKAQAWEAFNSSANQQEFEQRIGSLNLPKQAKADMWEAKYGSGQPQALTPPAASQNPTTPQPAPSAGQGALSKLWGWANAPINVGHLRQSIAEGEARENAPPSSADVKQIQDHPVLGPLYQGTRDFVNNFGTEAGKMLLTPLGAGLALAGPLGEEAGAVAKSAPVVAKTARAVAGAAAAGFAAKGAHDQYAQGVLPQQGESAIDYAARTSGNAAMMLGGVAEGIHLASPKAVPAVTGNSVESAVPPTPGPNPSDTSSQVAANRIAKATGTSKLPPTQTIHVSPDFAQEMSDWYNNDELVGKRVILDPKGKIKLANTNSDSRGFNFTNTEAKPKFLEEPSENTVPIELSRLTPDGTRGTSAPGHFLSAKIGNQAEPAMPVPEPETGQGAVAADAEPQPTEESSTTATAPIPTVPEIGAHPEYDAMARTVGSDGLTNMERAARQAALDPSRPPEGFLPHTETEKENIEDMTGRSYDPNLDSGRLRRTYQVGGVRPGVGVDSGRLTIKPGLGAEYHGPADIETIESIKNDPRHSADTRAAAQAVFESVLDTGVPINDAMSLYATDSLAKVMGGRRIKTLDGDSSGTYSSPLSRSTVEKKALLPSELSKAAPRYGYGTKNFQLDFEDPHDLAAYTLGQTKDNKAQAKFVKYLQSEYPDASLQDLKEHSLVVRSAIKDLAKDGDPSQGALKIPSQGGVQVAKAASPAVEPPPVQDLKPLTKEPAPTSNVDLKPLEDKIRPLAGQVMQLSRLRIGEAASHAIDRGIEASRSITGDKIDPETKTLLGKLLKEPVGDNLNGEQIAKLEKLRGAEGSVEPVLRPADATTIARETAKDPDAWQRRLDASMVEMADKIKYPNTPPELVAKLTKALMSEDKDGNPKPWLYERGTITYPQPEKLDVSHPEAPFTESKLGHEITPITLENLKAATGSQPRDTFFGRTGEKSLVRPEELAEYERLKNGITADPSGEPLTKEEELELSRKALLGGNSISNSDNVASEILGKADDNGNSTGSGSVFASRGNTSPEFRAYDRQLKQKVLSRKIDQLTQALKTQVGEWNKQRNGATTELTQQLAALSDEAKKHLPKELFDNEKSQQPQAPNPSKTPNSKQSLSTARTSPSKPAALKPGSETPFEGIRTNKWDTAIQKKYPVESQMLPVLQESIHEKLPVEQRQKMYDRVTKTYHDAIENGNTDALRVALDIAVSRGEAGYIDIGSGKGDPLLTPEQNRAVNLDSAQRILSRWEEMSLPELLKKKEGLWKNGLTQRIEGAAPIGNDPIQVEEHNELLARHAALKAQVGAPTNVMHSLIDWAQSLTETNPAEQMIRSLQGSKNRDIAIQKNVFDSADRLFESLPSSEKDRVWDAMQRGNSVNADLVSLMDPKLVAAHELKYGALPDVNDMLNRLRFSMDAARERYAANSGNLQEFITNYMPGMYENAGRARQLGMEGVGRQPLAGNADFLKQKIYEFQKEALDAGLQPITNNPIRAGLSMMAQLTHASTAYELRNKFVDSGNALWVPKGETPPTNWIAFDDRLFGERGAGQYFAPSNIANTFNNFVSTGLRGKWLIPNTKFSLYDAIRNSNNIQNLAQLSFSLFHGSDVIANSFLTQMAVAGQRVVNEGIFGGRLGKTPVERAQAAASGLSQFLKTPAAPIVAWGKGRNIEINFHDPIREQKFLQTTSDIEAANANVRPDQRFRLEQLERLKNAWNVASDADRSVTSRLSASAKVVTHAAAIVPEITSYPLMKSIIPAMKLGSLDMAFEQVHREFAGQPPDIINAELQKAADSIDNRFGEMNWDNIFWSRTTKDIAMLFGRAPGWALGTARELMRGTKDLPGTVKDIAMGKPVHVSGRTAYIGAMVAGTMLFNAVRQYANTGTKAEGIDYFYPWNGTYNNYGEKNREYPKFLYTYEGINWAHDPLGTAQHKLAPGFATLSDIAKNQDYYHHEIYDPGDTTTEQYKKVFGYMAKNFIPFSVQNERESQMRGGHSTIASAFGIMPAPQWVGRTKAENLAYTYYRGDQGAGGKDDSTFEKQKNFVQMRSLYQAGQLSPDQIQDAVNSGKIRPEMLKYLFKTQTQPSIVTWTKELRSPEQVWHIWQAATPEEKQKLLPTMFQRMSHLTSGDEQTHYFDELEKFANTLSETDQKSLLNPEQ